MPLHGHVIRPLHDLGDKDVRDDRLAGHGKRQGERTPMPIDLFMRGPFGHVAREPGRSPALSGR